MPEVGVRETGPGGHVAVADRRSGNLRSRLSIQGLGARRQSDARLQRAHTAARRDPRRRLAPLFRSAGFVFARAGSARSHGAWACARSCGAWRLWPAFPLQWRVGLWGPRQPAALDNAEPAAAARPGAASPPYPPRDPTYGESVPVSPSREAPLATRSVAATVTPAATLACPVVSALDRWVSEAIQPAAQRWFGQPVVEIKQISAYSCRGMNGNPRARISEHAFGNALDISAFVLADGHVVTIRRGWAGTPEEQGFLRDVQSAACSMFSTVLAPGSNRFHYDHIHVDLMRRDSGRQVCEPAAISGEVVAARARARGGYARSRPRDPGVTGTIAQRPRAEIGRSRHPAARFDDDRDGPSAVPGED